MSINMENQLTNVVNMNETVEVVRFSLLKTPTSEKQNTPKFSFRLMEVMIRKYRNWYCREINVQEAEGYVDVHLATHVKIENIFDRMGQFMKNYIKIEKRTLGVTDEDEEMCNNFLAQFEQGFQETLPSPIISNESSGSAEKRRRPETNEKRNLKKKKTVIENEDLMNIIASKNLINELDPYQVFHIL